MLEELDLPQGATTENPPRTKKSRAAKNDADEIVVVRVAGGRGGGGKRNMTQCLFGLRDAGAYTVISPHQELLDKGWEKIFVEAVFRNGVLDEYRIREAKDGENGPTLRRREKERPYYVLSNEGIIAVEPSAERRRYLVEQQPLFDEDGRCCIKVPVEWRVERAK